MLSVDDVERAAAELAADGPAREHLAELVGAEPLLSIENLRAGYGAHGDPARLQPARSARGQSLCLIGPNGAGKSTVLHSIYGFTTIIAGAHHASAAATSRT